MPDRRLRVLSCLQTLLIVGRIRRHAASGNRRTMPDATLARLIRNSLLLMRALNAAWPGITDCQTILQGFDAQYGRFLEVTSGRSSVSNKPTGTLSSRR